MQALDRGHAARKCAVDSDVRGVDRVADVAVGSDREGALVYAAGDGGVRVCVHDAGRKVHVRAVDDLESHVGIRQLARALRHGEYLAVLYDHGAQESRSRRGVNHDVLDHGTARCVEAGRTGRVRFEWVGIGPVVVQRVGREPKAATKCTAQK